MHASYFSSWQGIHKQTLMNSRGWIFKSNRSNVSQSHSAAGDGVSIILVCSFFFFFSFFSLNECRLRKCFASVCVWLLQRLWAFSKMGESSRESSFLRKGGGFVLFLFLVSPSLSMHKKPQGSLFLKLIFHHLQKWSHPLLSRFPLRRLGCSWLP